MIFEHGKAVKRLRLPGIVAGINVNVILCKLVLVEIVGLMENENAGQRVFGLPV